MGAKLIDLTGQRFHRLVAIKYLRREGHSALWLCRCDCGVKFPTAATGLRSGRTKSCGCYRRDRMARLTFKHGERGGQKRIEGSPEYKSWDSMRQRCRNPNDKDYDQYGGRGISVCPRWDSFETFLADMGRRPSSRHSLDRKKSDGNYEPGNCRWATEKQQARNRSNNRAVGKSTTIAEAAEKAGIPYKTVKSRLGHGWSLHDALSKPISDTKRAAARHTRSHNRPAGRSATGD